MVWSDYKIDEDWERKLRERERKEYEERERKMARGRGERGESAVTWTTFLSSIKHCLNCKIKSNTF